MPSIALIQNEVVKEHYLKRLSSEIDTSYEALVREVDKITKGIVEEEEKREEVEEKERKEEVEKGKEGREEEE